MLTPSSESLDLLCINTIRFLAIDAISKANSGHPGLPLGAAPMAYVLWSQHLKHAPEDPHWPDRDRFVLSAGHGSALLYSLLHLFGYGVTLDDLKSFRQWQSKTPGHPEVFHTPGVETTTGPLGQGAVNAIGMAIAERKLAHLFNRPGFNIVDHHTYALVSDGDLMEGITAEAASLAGHLKLGKLIYLYDSNDVTLDGPTSLSFSAENVAQRYEAYGWQVQTVTNGDTDLQAISRALVQAKADSSKPSLIIVKTTIGYGSPKAGTSSVHGSPLDSQEVASTKSKMCWTPAEPFFVPEQVKSHLDRLAQKGAASREKWRQLFAGYIQQHPDLARLWRENFSPSAFENLPKWEPGQSVATREASGKIIQSLAANFKTFWGGDADLSCSTNTAIKDGGSFDGQSGVGKNLHYGIREHAMAAVANGIACHGGLRHFVSTFFCFADYMRPAIRLAAMSQLPVIYVWTHDSIGVGEDGPTHQPVEHLASLRCMPGMTVIRPCDAHETAEAWKWALKNQKGPVGIVLSRQKLPIITTPESAGGTFSGAYILYESTQLPLQALLIATGSEVHLALQAAKELEKDRVGIRVISMPSWEIFAKQPENYRKKILSPEVSVKISIEAGCTMGWERWVGTDGVCVGIDHFGASAPGDVLMKNFGITSDVLVSLVRKKIRN